MRLPSASFVLIVLALVATASSCMSTVVGPDKPEAVALTRLGPAGHSLTAFGGYSEVQEFVVHDSTTMAFVWEMIFENFSPPPAVPVVNFDRDMVVVVALGTRPTGGYDIVLDSATRDAEGLTVYFRAIGPSPTSNVAQVVTHPVDVAVVPRTPGPVKFQNLLRSN